MIYIQWLFVAIIIVISLVGGYYQHQIIAHMKEGKRISALVGGWLFYPEYLDETGKAYRKKIIGCWVVIMLMIAGIQMLPN